MANEESSVRVAVRIRPQTPAEVLEGCSVCAHAGGAAGEGGVTLGSERAFTFDYSFEPGASQEQLYECCVRKLVEGALDGYNATVLAYGQTGSGKTYTMGSGWEGDGEGDEDRRGIIPRAIRDLFHGAETRSEQARTEGLLPPEFSVQAQFIELYNEDIVDLLDPAKDPYAKGGLRITEDGNGGVRIVGASCRPVRHATDALSVLRAGALARTTAATNMNSSSSRSHAVFTLMLRQRRLAPDQEQEKEDADTQDQYETLTAKFHFVDLAGSERLKRTGATGDRAREGISINCGLLALGNVISALGDKARRGSHVPYRDSKLTRLLQDSLGGNSNTVMIACVSPSDRDFMETLNTLKYANRARNIKNRCVLNQDLTSRTIHQLRQQVARLQLEIAEYKQGKRVVSENGEEGWSDVVQENAILTAEVESLRRRVKAMQGTIEQLSTKNSQLVAEKALGAWAPKDGGDTAECSLTTLVQGYVREIEELRAQLLESNAMYEATRKREAARTRLDSSVHDPATVIDDAKKELYKEKELLARSMGELEFRRMSQSVSEAMGERERAEGESDSGDDSDRSDDDADRAQLALSAELAALSGDIDTKQRLIEELELSQKRLNALRTHYEQRLNTLHHQIKATQSERDKVLASYAAQSSPPSDKLKRVKEDYERRLNDMSRELRRLAAASKEHARLQRAQANTAQQIQTLNKELRDMKRDKVKLLQRMREESKRHAAAEAARAKEVAQLRKESRKNANLIRTLEADRKMKEQVLRRKQEEVSLLRRGHRDRLSSKAAGRLHDRRSKVGNYREIWSKIDRWLTRAVAAKAMLAELEVSLEHSLTERERLRREMATSQHEPEAAREQLRYLHQSIAETQQQIMQLEEENDDNELLEILTSSGLEECSRAVVERVANAALAAGADSARQARLLGDTRAKLRQLEESSERTASALRAAEDQNLNSVWESWPMALLSTVSSGTHTRPVSPVLGSPIYESRNIPTIDSPPVNKSHTAPTSPAHNNNGLSPQPSPFQRNTVRRGSVRLRDLGVYGKDAPPDCMTQSMVEARDLPPEPAPLARVPSAPGSLRGLTPIGSAINAILSSPLTPRRTPESPRLVRRQNSLAKPASLEVSAADGTPPASPGVARRNRDDDVFLRLTGAAVNEQGPPKGVVKEFPIKRATGGCAESVRVQCTHVAEGHAGAALALAASPYHLYSGGVDRTVRAWDLSAGAEAWRAWCGAPVGAVCAGGGAVLAAAGGAVRVYDPRAHQPAAVLWSSGATGASVGGRGAPGETAVTALALAADCCRLYTATGDKIRLWDLRMLECLTKVYSGHAAAVMCLAVERGDDADLLYTGSKDHYVRTMELSEQGGWEAMNRKLLEPPHYDGVQSLASAAGVLYSASRDTSIKRWTVNRPALTHGVMNAHKGWVTGVVTLGDVHTDGYVASCGRDGALRLWEPSLRPAARAAAIGDAAHALAAHPDPNAMTLYTAGNGGEVRAWRLVVERG